VKHGEPPILVTPLVENERRIWQDFLASAANKSLYHDLDFLAYHPKERFQFEHLLLRQNGKILALLPGGLVKRLEGAVFVSPLGASFGGPVVKSRLRAAQALGMVQALQEYATARGLVGLDLTLAPAVFGDPPSNLVPFALFGRGFRLCNRWLCAMLDLSGVSFPRYEKFFRKTSANLVRASRRKGMVLAEYGLDGLPLFLKIFEDTYNRHGVNATHTAEEIAWLLEHLPDRVRLFLTMKEGCCLAGVLVFMLMPSVAYTFYICTSTAHAEIGAVQFLFADLADLLAERNVRWLDLGPCCRDDNFNAGVTFFKESLGCVMHCRDSWSWRAAWTGGPAMASMNFIAEED